MAEVFCQVVKRGAIPGFDIVGLDLNHRGEQLDREIGIVSLDSDKEDFVKEIRRPFGGSFVTRILSRFVAVLVRPPWPACPVLVTSIK